MPHRTAKHVTARSSELCHNSPGWLARGYKLELFISGSPDDHDFVMQNINKNKAKSLPRTADRAAFFNKMSRLFILAEDKLPLALDSYTGLSCYDIWPSKDDGDMHLSHLAVVLVGLKLNFAFLVHICA